MVIRSTLVLFPRDGVGRVVDAVTSIHLQGLLVRCNLKPAVQVSGDTDIIKFPYLLDTGVDTPHGEDWLIIFVVVVDEAIIEANTA